MQFIVKKTTELAKYERKQILDLFNHIFKTNRSLEQFDNQFYQNVLGYSYHSMIMDDGCIVGCNSFIPAYYYVAGERLCFVNSVDTMVSKPYRDFANLYDMMIEGFEYMKEQGIDFVYGFPNDNAYPVYMKSKLMKNIGKMYTYCLPYRISGVKAKLRFLNPLSVLFSQLLVTYSGLLGNSKVFSFPVEKDTESYNATRYKRLDGAYSMVQSDKGGFVYKIQLHENVKTAFLIDVFPKSPKNFTLAAKYIVKHHRKEFDLLLYVGVLPFAFSGLIRIPRKFEPKSFNFTGVLLNNEMKHSELLFDVQNWDINLSSYDLI